MDIAGPVDFCDEAGRPHPFGQPIARGEVLGRKGEAVHAGAFSSELGESAQVSEQALAPHLNHGPTSARIDHGVGQG